jgi:small subunit ribosomal protein S6
LTNYETTFIIDSVLKPEEIDGIIGKVERFITNNGGQIGEIQRWGKRRLAYEIKKRQYGYYVHIQFEALGSLVQLLEREYQLNESILRYLTVLMDKKALLKKKLEQKEEVTHEKEEKASVKM